MASLFGVMLTVVKTPARSPSRAAAPVAPAGGAAGAGTTDRAPLFRRASAAGVGRRRPGRSALADAERAERAGGAAPGGRERAADDRAGGELRRRGGRADPHPAVQRRGHLDQALLVQRREVPRVEAQRELAGELGQPQPLVGRADARDLGPGAREQLLLLGLDEQRCRARPRRGPAGRR